MNAIDSGFSAGSRFLDYECGILFPYYKWKEISLCKDCMDKMFMINSRKDVV